MERIKIIQICGASSSFAVNDYEEDIYRGWYSQVGFQLKKYFKKLEVECWTPERKYIKEKINNLKNIKFRVFPTNISIRHGMEISLHILNALKEEINISKKKNYRLIIHLHEYHTWLTYSILLSIKKNKNIKIIAQHHGGRSPFENLKKYKRLYLFFPLIISMQFLEKLLFKKIDTFYALNDKEIDYLKKIAPNSEIKFQTMGIEDKYFKRDNKEKTREKLKLKQNKRYLLYIGRIKTTKGIKELLDAISKIDNKNIELLIIGGGVDYDKYKKYAKEINLKDVKFLGEIYSDKKLDYLSACDCLILPSYTEGAPVVIMEALAKNLPVIATNVGGVNKMIKNGREGIIIKPKSSEEIIKAIDKVLTWKDKSISKYAEKYKWKRIIKDTINDYLK